MLQVTINEKGGQTRQENFDKGEVTIGRVQGNDIILPKGNISKRHSRIVLKDGKFIIVDLKSTNGTYVNGKKITAPQVVKASDKIYIGDFTLQLNGAAAEAAAEARAPSIRPARNDDEIDLFGGDASIESEASRSSAPGLIDDNFDQEFDGPEPAAKLPKPGGRRSGANRSIEPPADDDFGVGPDAMNLDGVDGESEFGEPDGFGARSRRSAAPQAPSRALDEPGPGPEPEPIPTELPEEALDADGESPAPTALPTPDGAPVVANGAAGPVASVTATPPVERHEVIHRLHQLAVQELGLSSVNPTELPEHTARAEQWAEAEVARLVASGGLHDGSGIAREVASLATDLSLIRSLLLDEAVVELEITPDGRILADREGRLEPIGGPVEDPVAVSRLVRQLGILGGAPDGPLVDVRLADGSRVVASLPPLSFRGPTLSLRKTSRDFFTLEKLLEYNTVSPAMMTFIDYCVRYRRNILLSVGRGVTATATLNALVAQMPTDDRVVTIEDGIELHLDGSRNLTALEPSARATVEQLLHHAVRMQADRAVIGGVTKASAADVVRAVSGPLEGSVVAYPASSPLEAVRRLADEELAGRIESSARARRAVASAFPVVLQEKKFLDNSRRIVTISEVLLEDDALKAYDLFTFTAEGVDENLIVTGTFSATGRIPAFLTELVERGEAEVDMEIFKA